MIDSAVYVALIGACTPVALLLVGYYLKRSAESRTQLLLAAAEATKVVAEANKVIAERTAELTMQNLRRSELIEGKVDGRLTKAVDDLAASRLEVKDLTTAFSVFQARVDSFLVTGVGRGALKEAAGQPMPPAAAPVTGNPSERKES